MRRPYLHVLFPFAMALSSHVLGCSGSEGEDPDVDPTSTSSSAGGGFSPTGGFTSSSSSSSSISTSSGGGAPSSGATTSTSSGGGAPSSGATTSSGGGNDPTTTTSSGGDASSTTTASSGGGTPTERFSFFVTSLDAMRELSGSQDGFGGDLRFGETGPGAGLRGADKICATIAEKSMPGAGSKGWRAFLSAAQGEDGRQVDAIDRIGEGPWYDRLGRLVANNKQELLSNRPTRADSAIMNDLPNEDGVPNHQPDPSQPAVDNHDTLTGSNEQGRLFSATATCNDWTSAAGNTNSRPRVGHSWPRGGGFGGPGGGFNGNNWISAHEAPGCAAGIVLEDIGGPRPGSNSVGGGGGYGGIYCFALTP